MVLERTALVVGVLVVVSVMALMLRSRARQRVEAAVGQPLPASLRQRFADGTPGIVYFYGPHCATCRLQSSIVEALAADEGITLVKIDATKDREMADALAIATVPTTVVVDRAQSIRNVNLNFYPRDVLLAQVRELTPDGRA